MTFPYPGGLEVWCPCCQNTQKERGDNDQSCLVKPQETGQLELGKKWELILYGDCARCECAFQIVLMPGGKYEINVVEIGRNGQCPRRKKRPAPARASEGGSDA